MYDSISSSSAGHHLSDSSDLGSDHKFHLEENDTGSAPEAPAEAGSYQAENGNKEYIARGHELVKEYWKKNRQLKSALERGWQDPIADYTGPTLAIYEENCLEALESYVLGCTEDRELTRIRSFVENFDATGDPSKAKDDFV